MSIQESIKKIRTELVEFAGECLHLNKEHIAQVIYQLSDAEVLSLYVKSTFENDWRGEILDALPVGVAS